MLTVMFPSPRIWSGIVNNVSQLKSGFFVRNKWSRHTVKGQAINRYIRTIRDDACITIRHNSIVHDHASGILIRWPLWRLDTFRSPLNLSRFRSETSRNIDTTIQSTGSAIRAWLSAVPVPMRTYLLITITALSTAISVKRHLLLAVSITGHMDDSFQEHHTRIATNKILASSENVFRIYQLRTPFYERGSIGRGSIVLPFSS